TSEPRLRKTSSRQAPAQEALNTKLLRLRSQHTLRRHTSPFLSPRRYACSHDISNLMKKLGCSVCSAVHRRTLHQCRRAVQVCNLRPTPESSPRPPRLPDPEPTECRA